MEQTRTTNSMRTLQLPLYKKALRYVVSQLFANNRGNSNPAENGEAWLLTELIVQHANTTPLVFFDVGANRGDYSTLIQTTCMEQKVPFAIHAFEPMTRSAQLFAERFSASTNITLNTVALTDSAGEAEIYFSENDSTLASLHKRNLLQPSQHQTIRTISGSTYVADNGIQKIHCLKIDTEGHELSILQGFGDFLRAETIDCIQFEYGGATHDAHHTLRELYQLLESRGFVVGRLMPHNLELQHYHPLLEDFEYRNYAALGKDLQSHS